MKTRITTILAGVATLHLLLISVITVSGGCKSPEALRPRRYATSAKEFLPPQPATAAAPEDVSSAAPATTELPETISTTESTAFPAETAPEIKQPAAPAETVVQVKEKLLTYKVESGDSLWKIARKFGVGTGELAAQNKLGAKPVLRVGQTLVIPPGGVENYKASAAPAVSHAKKGTTSSKKTEKAGTTAAAPSGSGKKYTVVSGDSIWKIAKKHDVKSAAIAEANHMSVSTPLKVGQVIIIPGKNATSASEVLGTAKSTAKKNAAKPAAPAALPAEETKALEALKTEETKSPDDLLKDIETPTAAPEKIETTVDIPSSSGDIVEVTEDITIEDFAKKHKVSVDSLKKANPGLPDNGKLSTNMIITMP